MWWNLKTQIVIQLNNTNWDETHKLKLRQNLTTQIVMKLKDPLWQNSKKSKDDKTQTMTKLKLWQNSNCDKTQIVTNLKLRQNSNRDSSNCEEEKNQQLKMW